MIPQIFADKICYYEGCIDDPGQLVDLIESSDADITDKDAINKWHKWVASGEGEEYVFGSQKFTDSSKLSTSSDSITFIYNTLKSALTIAGKDYANRFNIEYSEPAPISISKYQIGADMGPHVDYHGEPNIEPLMSAVTYLNDDLEGGELKFPEQGVTIKPKAGSIIVFPSVEPFYHQSLPVISGVKYMSPAFWMKKLS